MKKLLVLALTVSLFAGCSASEEKYEATVKGHNDDITISVAFDGEKITDVEVVSHSETEGIADKAISDIPKLIVENQSLNIDIFAGSTITSQAILDGAKSAIEQSTVSVENFLDSSDDSEEEKTIFEGGWNAIPTLGITKGEYFVETMLFGRGEGHTGILEVVVNDGNLVLVEFNEIARPDYHTNMYQNELKRYSEYNFMMGEIGGTALVQGILNAEQTVMDSQDLTVEIDYVAGATESIVQGFEPLAEAIDERLEEGSNQHFYRIAEDIGGGLTGILDVVIEDGKIVECMYDELFANTQDEIENPKHKKYERTSKYENIQYKDDSKVGFKWQMDLLNEQVVENQNMLDLSVVVETIGQDVYDANPAYSNYLSLAEKLQNEMLTDGVISK